MLEIDGYMCNFTANLTHFSTRKLCEIIITSRYLGFMAKESIMCMEELARRRQQGDTFNYELFIETESKKLPDFKINLKKKMQIGGLDLSLLKGIK